ncbi:hypothetical protein JY651_14955 [Pyxidicoccus parkwayensis]|uniref:RHS repeat-associated core domain-containing protein n=1 Tax=Pyxidicoccus parkwayensis TaxID=2813578 RepID=A0ABX7P6T5_9BACT|nr:RHS repeat-associated core domain-containing protein [Pyxidicoccus parkwaysis]QSQ26145.1 hypothetical protein JY651_14955 [Pyxidicoccus parkwaysis]
MHRVGGRVFLLIAMLGAALMPGRSAAQAQCLPGSNCCGTQPRQSVVPDTQVGRGDGQGGAAGLSRTYLSLANPAQTPVPRTYQVTESCTVTGACSPGSVRYEWECAANGLPAYEKAVKNKRDAWEVFTYAASAPGAGVPTPVLEKTAVKHGAQDMAGTGALEEEYFSYSYGPGAQQQVASSEKPSLLGGTGARARTFHRYNAAGVRVATIRSGWTQTLSITTGAAAIEKRWVGTFYLPQRTGEPTADPLGRIVEVHGPCWVDSEAATDCPSSTTFPLTQSFYWPDSEATLFRRNRLKKVARYPAGITSTPLVTQFNAYDAAGNVTESVDANGLTTLTTWADSRLLTETVRTPGLGDVVTRHGYDGAGHLAWTQRPEGNYEVFCYRTGTPTAACAGGQLTGLLQWKARSAVSDGATWSEKVSYAWWPDGSQKEERFLDAAGATRRVHSYAADAHRRPTLERWGEGAGSYTQARAYDGADNVTGVGLPSNSPPAWCAAGADGMPASTSCNALKYDRANRLVEITERPSDTLNQRSVFRYDAQGNVSAMKVGCQSTETYDTCTQPASTFTHDDFGNLVELFHPYMNAVTRNAYDALGNRVVHQSPVLRSARRLLVYTYDGLSRLRMMQTIYIDAATFLNHKLGYDNDETPPAGCETQLKSMGRLRYSEDSFGRTWYQYDDLGRVVREMKIRAKSTACNLGPDINPDTRYGYTLNGNLASITYPHGRKVTYVYGTGASADRVAAMDVTHYDGTAWQTQRILSAIMWEPYGGLRGYQQHHFGSGATRSVEYMLGDNASVAPASSQAACADTPPSLASSDLTGRVRSLRVSSGPLSLGAGIGDVYSRTYTWSADLVSRIDTCLLDSTDAQTEEFTYDRLMRLTKASRPTGNFAATGGVYSSRTYGYDRRGNRNSIGEEGATSNMSIWSLSTPDHLFGRSWGPGPLLNDVTGFDGDGRGNRKSTGRNTTGDGYAYFNLYPAEGPRDGDFKSASVGLSAYYLYYYDAFGRRRLKLHPSGAKDEYFHALGQQMLSDRSSDQVVAPATYYVEDDYVWLGDRPVAVVRGKFNLQWSRLADTSAQCNRAGTEATCGLRFIVTDHASKPVVLFDEDGRITGTGEYEPFGHVNRVTHLAATANPYPDNLNVELTRFRQPSRSGSLQLQERVFFSLVDTEPVNDFVVVKDGVTGATLAGPLSGKENVLTWTGWVTPGNGELAVQFVSNTSCAANACGADAGTSNNNGCTCAPASRTRGVLMQAYEYRRFESGASPFWIPLRLAGQYYDEELDLFEEWNRTYDPTSGRYFQPDPRLLDPEFAAWSALQGIGPNVYGYANHNPVGGVVRDGASGVSLPLSPLWNVHPAPGASLAPDPQLSVQLKHVLGSGVARPDGKGQ